MKIIRLIAFLVLYFAIAQGAFAASYYVDDGSTNGNVFTTVAGNDTNSGTSASAPKRTLTNLLASVSLAAGDVVYIDTGVYSNYTVTITNSGTAGNPIVFQGSTNVVAGGSVINRNDTGLDVVGLRGNYLEFRDLTVAGGIRGFNGALQFPPPSGVALDRVIVRGNNVALQRGSWTIRRSIFQNNTSLRDPNSSSFDFDQCVFWGNGSDTIGSSASITLSNSVYVGGDLSASMTGDYNVFWDVRFLSQERAYLYEHNQPNSTVADPGFANGAASNFYPLSVSGRYNPATDTIVTDALQSVLIDFGNIASAAWTNEPSPNGARINGGSYGGTGRASLSRTNAWLFALTFNDGGAVTGTTQTLVWNQGAFTNNATVKLQFSPDNGASWSNIASGVTVTNRSYAWNVAGLSPMAAVWRVMSESDTNVWSRNRQPFSVGGMRVPFYLNDPSTNESVYTTAVGLDSNDGLTPLTPKLTLTNLLSSYTLGRYDIIYIDTGIYSNYTTDIKDYGMDGQPLILQGVPKAGGSVFRRNANASIFQMLASYHLFRNLTLEGAGSNGSIYDGIVTLENSIIRSNIVGFRRGTITVKNSLMFSNTTVIVSDAGSINFDQCVFWRNGQIQSTLRPWSASNSVFVGGTVNGLAYVTGADYSTFWDVTFEGYPSLSELQRVSQQWTHSSFLNPRFANPDAGNFYPQSVTGRYDPTITNFVVDGAHSPLIDFGNPLSTLWTNEPTPNGGRVNIGSYGGTAFASKSRTNAWLQALSLNDGGQLNIPGERVYWNFGNISTAATIRIEFSFNSGFSWNVFATNVSVSAGFYTVNATNFPSSRYARWRVVLESDPAVSSANAADFIYRSGPYTYYVNDASLVGDVYSTAAGNDVNLGTTPDSPKSTISGVITNYTLGPGDVVYVDTGVYLSSVTIPVTLLVSGTNGNPVVIQGSSNVIAGGSVILGAAVGPNAPGFTFASGVQNVDLRDLIIQRRTIGVSLSGNTRIGLQRMRIESNFQAGVSAAGVSGLRILNTSIRANVQDGLSVSGGGDATVLQSALWMNSANAILTTSTRVMVTNSVLGARGAWARIYNEPTGTNIVANYNLVRVEQNASSAIMGGIDRELNSLSAWRAESGMDRMSLDCDPQFVSSDVGDFHLRSQTIQGRFDPILGWVTDTVTSPLLDAGDPAFAYANETAPNGGRANIGIYGNTVEASRSDSPRLFAGNLNQGGYVRGTSTVHWVTGGLASNELVQVDISVNGGETWATLHTGVLASVEQFSWNTTTNAPAVAGLWRVKSVNNPTIASQTTNFFGIRNAALSYYVNDGSTYGDLFTSGSGSATNWVASTNRPLDSLARVFDRYDLEPGDQVYVDHGTYSLASSLVVGLRNSGAPTSGVVTVIGAPTCPGGATPSAEFVGSGGISQVALLMDQARYVVISNLAIRQTGTALTINQGQSLQFDGLRFLQTATNGVAVNLSTNIEFRRSLFAGSSSYGWAGKTNNSIRLINSMFVSNAFGSVYSAGGSLGVTNSAFIVDEPGLSIFTMVNNGVVRSDYNNFRVSSLANIANYNGRLHKFPASWQESTSNDLRSLSHDPGFFNAGAADYHLLSTVGRRDGSSCGVVTDVVNSVMMDAGNPAFGLGSEPAPNGGRINIGLYGGSPEASMSSTNGRLLTLSLNSGGTIRGTNTLYWSANQAVTGDLVYIDVSFDNGLTWTNIATNLSAATGFFVWDASQKPSSALGRWRIGSQNSASISATTEVAFTLNNGSIGYYVNDASTNGDVYATAPGSPSNDGLSAGTPVTSVESIFSHYQPTPGDIIYIDTGNYQFSSTINLDANNSGVATNPVLIQGSTNWMMGGARINMNRQGPLFQMVNVNALTFSDLILTNGRYGFAAQISSNLLFNRIIISGATNMTDAGSLAAFGFRLDGSSGVELNRVVVKGVTNRSDSAGILLKQISGILPGTLAIKNSVLWSNAYGIWAQAAAPVSMSNSIIYASGDNAIGMRFLDASQLQANFNDYRVESNALLAELNIFISTNLPSISMPVNFTTMQSWRDYTGKDTNSLTYDPGFANPAELDFGLLSSAGRWTPSGLLTDSISSVLMDAGNPAWVYTNEPAPNGSRVNMGPDGNSSRASLTPTNRALVLLSLCDGGIARGANVLLRWDIRGDFTGKTVRLELSSNLGQTWQTITSGLPAGQLQFSWKSTDWPSGFDRKWRVYCEQDPTVVAQSEKSFAVRNTNFVFFVNDDSVTGDVYAAAAGSSGNTGLSTNQPKRSLQEIINTYALAGGDTVYVDTGIYSTQGDIAITPRDQPLLPGVITFIGSTNWAAGGTVLQNGGFQLRDVRDTVIKNFSVKGTASAGIRVNSSTNIQSEWVTVAGAGHGLYIQGAVDVRFGHTAITGSKTNGIKIFDQNRRLVFDQGIIWTNQGFAVDPIQNIAISNSVLAASGANKFIYTGSSNQSFGLNYNLYFITNGARLAQLSFGLEPFPREFANLASWRNIFQADAGSMNADPQFADPGNLDFHPRSTGGRWSDATTGFVADVTTSPQVDSGDPAASFVAEPDPNGGRMNIGLYGNSPFASKSPAAADYLLVRLNDGGSVSGTNVILSWVARGVATGHTTRVEFSVDGGASWSVLASNIPPTTTTVSWNTTGLVSTVVGLWRVTSEVQPSIATTAAQFFSIRNGPVSFYVNDNSMVGDVYTTTNGSSTAAGISPTAPINSLGSLLAQYDIEPGDVVYMDTGVYTNTSTIVIDQLDAGFRLVGSTNTPAGGSRLVFSGPQIGIQVLQAPQTQIENLRFGAVSTALKVDFSDGVVLHGLQIEGAGTGVQVFQSDNLIVRNSSLRNGTIGIFASLSADLNLDHLVIWSNLQSGVSLSLASASLQNSVVGILGGPDCIGIDLDATSTWTSEYNLFNRAGDGVIARRVVSGSAFDLRWQRVTTWSLDTGNDLHSLTGDPGFAGQVAGDFHPRSIAGRYNIASGLFTNDVTSSVLIDAGAPLAAFSIETEPNGRRSNIGMYGNTFEASRSPTNGRLTVARLNDGGRAEGPLVPLTWVASGAATSHTVRLEASFNDGASWSVIQSNVPAQAESLFWDSQTNASWFGRWRVISEQTPSISGTNTDRFAVRNAALSLYMNDDSTAGDVYTGGVGNDSYSGAQPSQPRLSLQSLLDDYDLEPGDTIYVDTGEYLIGSAITVGRFDAWNNMANLSPLSAGGISLRIVGSTNDAAEGSRFVRSGLGNAFELDEALGLDLASLSIQHVPVGGGISINVSDSPYLLIDGCRLTGGTKGISLSKSDGARMRYLLARNATEHGILISESTGVDLRQSVLWSNTIGLAVENKGSVKARNNAVVALAPDSVGWQRNDGPDPLHIGYLDADFNLLWATNKAFIAELAGLQYPAGRKRFERLQNWNEATALDLRSVAADPLFANSTSNDFHPRSPYGRYVAGSGYVTNVEKVSPLLDAGDPNLPFSQETSPNGQRVNIGSYGNTPQSSLSSTNGSLQVLSFRDGGASSGDITLRWAASGAVASQLLTLQFSSDGGATWTNIASNVLASTQAYVWDSEPYGRAAAGLWRITSQSNTNITSQNDRFFALRQGGSIPYYVNDSASLGDVYCTALGNDANTGFLPSTPKRTLQALLDDIDLESGDVVYMDTGTYAINVETLWGELDGGTATNPVVLRGSTNVFAGGTVMDRITGQGSALRLSRVEGVAIRDMTFVNGTYGVSAELSQDVQLKGITARANLQAGVRSAGSSPVLIENSLFWNNPTNGVLVSQLSVQQQGQTISQSGFAIMRNNTVWGSKYGLNVDIGGSADLRNNLIRVNGSEGRIYFLALGQSATADYNAYYRQNGALMAERVAAFGGNEFYARLLDWQRDQGNDLHSLSHDPMVADSASGDFHLISAGGRVLPSGLLTYDSAGQYSPLIDTGDPAAVWTNEWAPAGGRVNIGRYGNTSEASRSSTNGWLLVLTLNDGGRISGTNIIRWAAGNWSTNSKVRVEYANNGVDYTILGTNLPAYQGEYVWDASGQPITQLARWKVVSEENPTVSSAVQVPFVIKNTNLLVYVNDNSTNGNVYTFASGSPTNSGLSPGSPLDDPGVALDRFPFSEGDILYIDTGVYTSTNAFGLRLGLIGDTLKSGLPGAPIHVVGSTNLLAGGTQIRSGDDEEYGIHIFKTQDISLEYLNFSGFTNGVYVDNSEDVSLSYVSSHSNEVGYLVDNVISARFDRCTAWNNKRYGLNVDGAFSSAVWDHGVLWSNNVSAIRHMFGPLSISNSVLGSASSTSVIYEIRGTFTANYGDFNVYWPNGSDVLMRDLIGGVNYPDVRSWQRARHLDTNSFVADPLFINPEMGDFHLQSDRGRYVPGPNVYALDSATSWAIDAGAIGHPFDLEPAPNGSRLNIGLYGNTVESSLSSTNRALFVVSLRDGGTAASPQPLIWLSRGLTTADTVRIEYTPNNGIDWDVLATNLPALGGSYLWVNDSLESTPLARWRITLESNASIADTSTIHKVRNGSILYYVNDTNQAGDVYTQAPGSPLNNGITVSTPVHSVSAIINRFQLEGGDVVYVDTGYYELTNNIIIKADDSGVASNRVAIRGSTNLLAGGSRFFRVLDQPWSESMDNTNAVFELIRVQNLEINDLVLENANSGIYVFDSPPQNDNLYLHNLDIRDGGYYGVKLSGSFGNTIERVLIHRLAGKGVYGSGSSAALLSSVLWSNQGGAIELSACSFSISNSVLHAFGAVTNAIITHANSTVISDYNDYFAQGEVSYALVAGEPISGLPQWTQLTTQDLHSISVDPLFANPTNNDFHPRSVAGRFDPVIAAYVTNDLVDSWLIDSGEPGPIFTNEPPPNGSRRNIGLFGGTAQASKSRGDPWLLCVTAMAGGRIGGIFPLFWDYGNLSPTNQVNLDFSVDGGTNWFPIASNILINVDFYIWNSLEATPFNQSPIAKWRVSLIGNTNVMDETDHFFGLNGPFRFFVNDSQTTGDVFTTTAGSDANLGLSSNTPKATLRAILDAWDMDPEDYVYVDTGSYLFQSNDIATLRLNNRGAAGKPVTILGSTNGSVLDGSALAIGEAVFTLLEIDAPYVELNRVNLRRGQIDAAGTNIVLRNMDIAYGSVDLAGRFGVLDSFVLTNGTVKASGPDMVVRNGYVTDGSLELSGTRAALENTVVAGHVSPLVKIAGTNVTVINNTLVAGQTAIEQEGADSRSTLRNNILVANGALGTAFAIERQAGVVQSDYNMFYMRNGAWYGSAQNGLWERLIYWQQKSGGDSNSITADPLFASEVTGDFRLRSVGGRYQNGTWVTDVAHSVAIDAGAPFDIYTNETLPNGGRINMGAFGNTEQASRSRNSPWLYAVTMNDGGVARGTNTLRWLAGGMSSTNRVTIQYSANAGTNWITIVSGVPAFDGTYDWDTSTASNTLDALWRVVLDGNPSVSDQSDALFNIRNDSRAFYVDDSSTNGDVFTTAPGSSLNDGRTPATPKATLEDLLATYDTEPNDTVYIDTGIYTSSVIQVIWSRGGNSNANMTIRGSTNFNAGGTVFRRPARSGDAMVLNASYVTLKNLIFENAARGLLLETNHFVQVNEVIARSNIVGVAVKGGGDHFIRSSHVLENTGGGIDVNSSAQVDVENISFINNSPFSLSISNTPNSIMQNNIFYHDVATSNTQSAIWGDTGTVYTSFVDYNVYYFGALARSNTTIYGAYTNLLRWQRERFKDFRSSITNPLFQSVANNNFYLRSEAGRYDQATKTFVNDTNTSWAIDAGNPFSVFSQEPTQNGGRINIGAYGNTPYASKGLSNQITYARIGNEFLPISEADNPYPLIWHVQNVPYNLTFSVQYSGDGGNEWITLQSGVPAYQEYIFWTNSPTYNSFNARWRVIGEGAGNTNWWDINDGQIRTFFGTFRISSIIPDSSKWARFVFRGAWDEDYQLQYATNVLGTNRFYNWQNLGPITNLTIGGDIVYTDLTSTQETFRVYRVIWLGTNGIPYQ